MSFKLTVDEEPRLFAVNIGYCKIGTVKSYKEPTGDDDEESYLAHRVSRSEENGKHSLGWYRTLEEAVTAVVEYEYGSSKITKITERPV